MSQFIPANDIGIPVPAIANTPTSVIADNLSVSPVDIAPLKRFRTFIKRISTSNATKQGKPDVRINNPFNIATTIYAITIIPDNQSKTDAQIELYIDDDQSLVVNKGDLTDVSSLNLALPVEGKSLDPQKFIDLFFWNQGVASNLTIIVTSGVK